MTVTAAILAYHAVERGPGPLCVSPDVFRRQIEALAESDAVVLSVSDLAERMRSGTLPPNSVSITFDDGYESVHRYALPILTAHGYVATVFPVTSQLGGVNAWGTNATPRLRLLDRDQLGELAASGWEVGSHTHTHRPLVGLSEVEVNREIRTACSRLQDVVGLEVRSFAYPYGAYDEVSRRAVHAVHDVCVGIGASLVTETSASDLLDRVDAWYVRRPWQIRHLHGSAGHAYLGIRRAGRRFGLRLRRA